MIDMEDRTTGIFTITNHALGMVFVGCSSKLREAKYYYLTSLRRGSVKNRALQEDFDTYGEKEFEFQVAQYCPKEELMGIKKIYTDHYRALGKLYDGEKEKGKRVSLALAGKKYDSKYNKRGWSDIWPVENWQFS
jgi:hypothetical protein